MHGIILEDEEDIVRAVINLFENLYAKKGK